MKMKKVNILDFHTLHEGLKPIFRENSDAWLVFKLLLMVFLITVVTIVIHKYTYFVESSNEKKMERIKQEKIDNFIENFVSEEGFDAGEEESSKYLNEPTEYLWEKDTPPFSFNSNSIFQKKYGFLDEASDNVQNYQEGFEGSKLEGFNRGFLNAITRPIRNLWDRIVDIGNKIRDAFEWLSRIDQWIDDTIIKPTRGWFQNIFDEISSLKERLVKLGYGFQDLFNAIKNTFVTLGYAIATEATDIGNLIVGGGECLANFFNNIRGCFIFYLLDLIGTLLYSAFMIIPWLFDSVTGMDTVGQINVLNTYIEKADSSIKKSLGFSVIHYPKSIINTCYRCRKVNFTRLVDQLYNDTADINHSFKDLGQQYEKAGDQLLSVFKR